jgi:hypothetical protein
MPVPGEHKNVQARILENTGFIGRMIAFREAAKKSGVGGNTASQESNLPEFNSIVSIIKFIKSQYMAIKAYI